MEGEYEDVSIQILTRTPSASSLYDSSSENNEEVARPLSPVGGKPKVDRDDDEDLEAKKKTLDENELRRDLRHIVFFIVISGAVVALNLMGMLTAIPRLSDHLTSRIFTLIEIQKLAKTLSTYAKAHFVRTLTVQLLLGTWVQTFMIPGATVLNMLAGNNFGMKMGLAVSMIYNTVGSILLYLISRSVGRRIIRTYLHDRVESFRKLFQSRMSNPNSSSGRHGINTINLVIYLTALRIFPFTPNWLLNVSLASLDFPLTIFIPSLVLGMVPFNYLAVSAGTMLQDLSSVKIINAGTSFQLGALAAVGLTIPSLIRRLRGCLKKEAQGPTVDYYWKQVQKVQRDEK